MSSVEPADDLTARARIRNVAIAHFARDGFQRAELPAIAAAAGVSVELIVHHFGSKDGLRAACDAYLLGHASTRADGRPPAPGYPNCSTATGLTPRRIASSRSISPS